MLGAFQETLETWLRTERLLPKAQRRTARRLFEGLQVEGYRGAYPMFNTRQIVIRIISTLCETRRSSGTTLALRVVQTVCF